MQEHTIPVAYLVLPVLLPFGQSMFLKHLMSGYNKYGTGSLEPNTSLDAYYSVTYVHITSYAVA